MSSVSPQKDPLRTAARAVAKVRRVPVDAILAHGRKGCCVQTLEARRIAMYLAVTLFDCSLSRVARESNRSRAAVMRMVRLAEDKRDDPQRDASIARIERLIMEQELAA